MYKHFFKRFLNFTLSLIGLVVISPLFLVLMVILTIANRGAGAFFTQAIKRNMANVESNSTFAKKFEKCQYLSV
jgi:lipopolysaccharide/colanic/teichoic acid biosynthesis glycosyltransferase